MIITTTTSQNYGGAFPISIEDRLFYEDKGYIHLNNVFSEGEIINIEKDTTAAIRRQADNVSDKPPGSESDTYQQAFTQVMNLWREDDRVAQLVFSQRLAQIAADLLGVDGVRLYHDQALYKEVGGGATPWHCDQYYWPIESEKTITAWIPLQATSLDMGPLAFCAGSHRINLGRQLPIGDDSESQISEYLAKSELQCIEQPFAIGDVSFHSGWTLHNAGANNSNRPRRAMTVIYMENGAKLKKPENPNQQADLNAWCPGATIGEPIASELNPLIYNR